MKEELFWACLCGSCGGVINQLEVLVGRQRQRGMRARVAGWHRNRVMHSTSQKLAGSQETSCSGRQKASIHACSFCSSTASHLSFQSLTLLEDVATLAGTGDLTPGDREASMLDSRQLPPGCYNVAKKHLQTDTSESSYTQTLPPPSCLTAA